MNERERLARLQAIGALRREMALAALSEAARARDRSLVQLARLDHESPETDLPVLADQQVRIAYRRWADKRRADLNLTLARQTVDWIARRDAAVLAVGRADVLNRLSDRLKGG